MNTVKPQGCLKPNDNTLIPTRENAHVNQSFELFCVICKMRPEYEVLPQNNMRQHIISNRQLYFLLELYMLRDRTGWASWLACRLQ